MRLLQLILIDSLSESFPSAGRISQQNQIPCTCPSQMPADAMFCDRRNTLLASNLGKACTQRGPETAYALPNAKHVERSRAPWVSSIAATPAGPLCRLGPDSSAASGGPFVTCRASKLEDWLIFHWLSISRNCLDVLPQYVSWVFHGFRKHLKLQDYMWVMMPQVNCGAFSVFWLEQWSEEQGEFLRNFTKMEPYWWIAKCWYVGRFFRLQRRH